MQVAITGCGTLKKGELISRESFFDLYPELKKYEIKIELLGESPQHTPSFAEIEKVQESLYTKHFIVIQNGCDNHCSFCLTVVKRGKQRSRALEEIITEIKQIEARGGQEIVLT
jgi:threonylcarbamoyladenosine tRNA methylthiotransferase MtaB